MNEIRQMIREELRKMRLDERKEGHDIVMKVAKLVRDKYVQVITDRLTKNPQVLDGLDRRFEKYTSMKANPQNDWERGQVESAFDLDGNPNGDSIRIVPAFHRAIVEFPFLKNVILNVASEMTSTIELAPIWITIRMAVGRYKSAYAFYGSNEDKRLQGNSVIGIVIREEDMLRFLKSSGSIESRVRNLIDGYKAAIVHEVQHYYDDMRDNEYSTTRNKGYDADDNSSYYRHPKEINTFFTQAASTIPLAIRGWDDVEYEFFSDDDIKRVIRYNGDKIRKYYLKRLYTLWSKTNKAMNLKTKGKDLTRKIDKISDELAARYPEQLPLLHYSRSDNVIFVPLLLAPTIKDEIEIHKNLIRLADKYRKMIAVEESDKRLDTKEQNARIKYLKKLGYKLNRNKEILFGTMYIRNPKR